MKIGVIEREGFSKEADQLLQKIGSIEYYNEDQSLAGFLRDKDALFIRLKHYWNEDLIKFSPNLKYICTPTTGLNHIDLMYCEANNIKVISLKGESDFLTKNIKATPEHTFGLLLSLLRKYNRAFLSLENRDSNRDHYKGKEIFQKNIGIIGFGRVGKILAKYFAAFGANVLFFDRENIESSDTATKCNNISDLIEDSDIIILSASYDENNSKMIGPKYIDKMKGKYFINTARGELVDEEYLIEKISHDHFAGVALDVISNENADNNLERLIDLTADHDLILTPHISGATFESMLKTEQFIAQKLINAVKGDL